MKVAIKRWTQADVAWKNNPESKGMSFNNAIYEYGRVYKDIFADIKHYFGYENITSLQRKVDDMFSNELQLDYYSTSLTSIANHLSNEERRRLEQDIIHQYFIFIECLHQILDEEIEKLLKLHVSHLDTILSYFMV